VLPEDTITNMINSPGGRDMRQPPICAGVWLLAHIG